MLKIRLQRVGRKHDPSYRVILTDVRQGPKSGKFIENLGFYDARKNLRQIKGERIKHWIDRGAQVSNTVHNILITEKVIVGKKINVLPKKSPIVKEASAEPEQEEKKEASPKETVEVPEAPAEEEKKEAEEETKKTASNSADDQKEEKPEEVQGEASQAIKTE